MKVTFGGNEVHLFGTQLKEGDILPDFTLTDISLNDVESKVLYGPKVILTFPSVDTSVCSLELLTFNDQLENFPEYKVLGVSMDLPFALKRWVKENAGDYITMLSDHKFRVFGEVTGTYVEELGILTRAAFVVDENNKITYAEYLPEIGHEPNYERIMEEARKIFK
jgi:thiol peroxidase